MLFDESRFPFAMVSDLDRLSRDPNRFAWRSFYRSGVLVRDVGTGNYTIEWAGTPDRVLWSNTATKNRSMELSELVRYKHWLLGFCDITGLAFKIKGNGDLVLQRWAIADGDGESVKPFKSEWATVKDGSLWVGSTGKEWTNLTDGSVIHRNHQWVKILSGDGDIENVDWGPVYAALRKVTGTAFPGYLIHEAVVWDPRIRKWLFLPRKASVATQYNPINDQRMGTNLLIIASENFAEIEVKELGPKMPEYGFSSFRKVPGSDGHYLGIKTKEIDDDFETIITVFDADGKFYLDPPYQTIGNAKFEGLEFTH